MQIYATLFRAVITAFRNTRVQALMLICALIALVQAAIFVWLEGWRFLDAFYFAVVSMATVGYGDFVPQTSLGKICAMGFLLVGIGVFVLTVSSIAQVILQQVVRAEEIFDHPHDDEKGADPR